MGGIFGRRKANQYDPNLSPYNDPFYQGGSYGAPATGLGGYNSAGGLGGYDPYGYGYYEPTEPFDTYLGPSGGPDSPYYGGRYSRGGYTQNSGRGPWNYGNFYMGNTTMQMMPYMQRKVAKYEQRFGMGGGAGAGGGCCGGCMPMMPMMPCLPAACAMPMAAPMMAVAVPLPMACNPLVQGMYPMAGGASPNFMTPNSFMSALSNGPMAYRPPPSFQFPSNVGMVMTVPFGNPNPLLTPSSFGGFAPQSNPFGGLSCGCCFCAPPAPPPVTFCPRPVPVPQPYPVPCPIPVPIPNIQQVPVPRPVTCIAPPILAGGCQPLSMGGPTPLMSSYGGFSQNSFGPTLVMASNNNTSTTQTLFSDDTSKDKTSRQKSMDKSRRTRAQEIAASLSNLGINNNLRMDMSSTKRRHRHKSNRISDNHSDDDLPSIFEHNRRRTADSDWLASDALLSMLHKSKTTRPKKSTHRPRLHHHHHRHSIQSDHDCVACKLKDLDKF